MPTPAQILDSHTRPGRLFEPLADGAIRCLACAHRCVIKPGKRGVCQVRFNHEGELRVPWGYVSTAAVDPVEKKPFYHLLPGSRAFTFGMLGCDFHCGFCQNWFTSQILRDEASAVSAQMLQPADPAQIVASAQANRAPLLVSSYNEPLITTEWAEDIFRLGQEAGLRCAYVSNGNATPEVLEDLRPYLTAYKVDLKSMQQKNYRELGGSVKVVMDTIARAREIGFWVEVVTLLIPGYNNSDGEVKEMAAFLASVSPDLPWHITAFHPDYRMNDPEPTGPAHLQRAADIAQQAGLNFVYAGNLPGEVGSLENTYCPKCKATLVERRGFYVKQNRVTPEGKCPDCNAVIPGVWS